MKPTLSAHESKLLLKLAWEKKNRVSLKEMVRILSVSTAHAYKIASTLCDKKWLERLKAGIYQVIPFEGGPKRISEMNPYVIGHLLDEPYFFSYATANTHYGFSPQVYNTLFIVLTKQRRAVTLRETKIQFVTLSRNKFFGFTEVEIFGEKVKMAEPEKALIDSLDKPQYAGGIEEVFGAFEQAKRKIDFKKLVAYALRFKTTSLVQRLGFLLDFLKLPVSKKLRQKLLKKTRNGQPIPLAIPRRFGRKGEFSSDWKIIQNMSDDILRNR
ncbi:MAG: hypothetical protein HY586_02390 [Candidatus Omnitrophica bacterium]|nr:hypothetical protein [Candidatus Omnitrophota bacterium]